MCMQKQSTKDVEFEDQQGINKFNKLFTRSGEVEAEIKAKKVGQQLWFTLVCLVMPISGAWLTEARLELRRL